MSNFQAIKNFQNALNDTTIMNLQLFWILYHRKNLLKSSYQKKYLLKFSYLENPKIENVKSKKILWFDLLRSGLGSELHNIY